MTHLKTWIARHSQGLASWGLFLGGLVLYANILPNGMFWDDDDFIRYNVFLGDWRYFRRFFTDNLTAGSGILIDYWRPALLTVWSVGWHLWQDAPFGYHLLSSLCHAANAVLLYGFLSELWRDRRLAWLTALLFLVHPLQTEAVAYASGLGDPLYVFFVLIGLRLFLQFRTSAARAAASPSYWLVLAMFVIALMSKETAVIFPGLLLLTDLGRSYHDAPGRPWRERWVEVGFGLWPFIFVVALYVWLRLTALNFVNVLNLTHGDGLYASDVLVRTRTFFRVLAEYIQLLFVPLGLRMERNPAVVTDWLAPAAVAGAAIWTGMFAAGCFWFRRHPALAFGWLWFLAALIPVSGVAFPINGVMYEHFLYLPMAGFWLALVWLGLKLAARSGWRRPLGAVAVMVVLIFSGLTIRRNTEWRDPVRFFELTRAASGENYRLLMNLGNAYSATGDPRRALEVFGRAKTLDPDNALAYHNSGNAHRKLGDADKALSEYLRAVAVDPGNRILYDAPLSLLLEQGDTAGALAFFEGYLPHARSASAAYHTLAQIALRGRDPGRALRYLEQAAAASPADRGIRKDIDDLRRLMSEPK